MQQFWLAALVFCCLAVRPRQNYFLLAIIELPEKTKSDRDWQAIGWFRSTGPCGQLMVSCIFIPFFSRETSGQEVINCKQAQTSCCLEDPSASRKPGY